MENVPEKNPCKSCVYGQRTQVLADLHRARICGRYPPNLPMPGPAGQGVVFIQPFVTDEGTCGEHESVAEVKVSLPDMV